MIWRLLVLVLIAWVVGFALFLANLGRPLDPHRHTDAIVVLTGGGGRMDRGLQLIRAGAAQRMLVSGVDRSVGPASLARHYQASSRLFTCCIDLGYEAVDTRSNAEETAQWVQAHGFRTVRLVTSDWHMPRARLELRNALGKEVELLGDGVPTDPQLRTLLREYHKYLVRRIALLLGAG